MLIFTCSKEIIKKQKELHAWCIILASILTVWHYGLLHVKNKLCWRHRFYRKIRFTRKYLNSTTKEFQSTNLNPTRMFYVQMKNKFPLECQRGEYATYIVTCQSLTYRSWVRTWPPSEFLLESCRGLAAISLPLFSSVLIHHFLAGVHCECKDKFQFIYK